MCWIPSSTTPTARAIDRFEQNLMSGYKYWKNTFFLPDGTPKYYNHKTLPIDIQCCSQAIDTLVFFHDRDPESLALALKVAKWTIEQMQDRTGYFYYRRYSRVAGQQNSHAALGTGDHALRARRTLQTVVDDGALVVKKKVLIIVENEPVPFDTRVWKEASSLHQNGYEVTVLCPRGKGYERRHEVIDGIHIYRHPAAQRGKHPLGYLWEYGCALFWEFFYTWWIFLRRGFHVIQGCNPPDDIFLIALPFKLLGVKYIFDHHDANPELYLSKYPRKDVVYKIQVWLESLTYRFSDVVMATNSSYRDIALTRGGLDPEDVFIVRNGPDLRTFRPVPPNPALKYGKPYLIGYVGTMSVQEGLDILLDVALHIKKLGTSRRSFHLYRRGAGIG